MSYARKPLFSPCARCGEPVADEAIAVRTLTNFLPYTPKIWHRPCFEQHKALESSARNAASARQPAHAGA